MKAFSIGAVVLPVAVAIAPLFSVSAQQPARTVTYTCDQGKNFRVAYSPNAAQLTLENKRLYQLRQIPSASGARYAQGNVFLVTKGNGAFVTIGGKRIYTNCMTNSPMPTEQATVTGTVSYLQRIALPPNAVVEVKLVDVSRMDAPSVTLATQTIPTNGQQVPIAFSLPYRPEQINPSHSYAVQARILVDGQLRWISTSRYSVITRNSPTQGVDIRVEQVRPR